MRETRCMSLLPWTTLHSDSEHYCSILHFTCRLLYSRTGKTILESFMILHCKPGKANKPLKTASSEAGIRTTLMCSLEFWMWSLLTMNLLIDENVQTPECHLYLEIMKCLTLSCQGSIHHPSSSPCFICILKVSPAEIELPNCSSKWSYRHHYTMGLLWR